MNSAARRSYICSSPLSNGGTRTCRRKPMRFPVQFMAPVWPMCGNVQRVHSRSSLLEVDRGSPSSCPPLPDTFPPPGGPRQKKTLLGPNRLRPCSRLRHVQPLPTRLTRLRAQPPRGRMPAPTRGPEEHRVPTPPRWGDDHGLGDAGPIQPYGTTRATGGTDDTGDVENMRHEANRQI